MMGCAACPTLYAQHWTKVLTCIIGPYIASAFAPRYFIICRLNSTVSIPIATSMKKVEKPVTDISRSFVKSPSVRTSRSVFLRLAKCVSMTAKDIPEPIAVASPAPYIPISQVNTKK